MKSQVKCEECEESADEVPLNTLFDCFWCSAILCIVCNYDHFIKHLVSAVMAEEEDNAFENLP